jgi:hypothetical protein
MLNYILIEYTYKSINSGKKKLHVILKCVTAYLPEINYNINLTSSRSHCLRQKVKLSLCLIIKHYSMKAGGGVEIQLHHS